MSSFEPARRTAQTACVAVLVALLAGCTAQPLNSATTIEGAPISSALRQTTVDAVETRTAQQVRNRLLFAMHGGRAVADERYAVALDVRTLTQTLAVPNDGEIARASQVQVTAAYKVREASSGQVIATGRQAAVASYDRTNQQFANQRAERDAQNRAAIELADRIHREIAQRLASR